MYSHVLNPEKWLTLEGMTEFQGRSNSAQRAQVVTKGKTASPEERVAESLERINVNKDQETGMKIVWGKTIRRPFDGADSLCRLEDKWEIIMER